MKYQNRHYYHCFPLKPELVESPVLFGVWIWTVRTPLGCQLDNKAQVFIAIKFKSQPHTGRGHVSQERIDENRWKTSYFAGDN